MVSIASYGGHALCEGRRDSEGDRNTSFISFRIRSAESYKVIRTSNFLYRTSGRSAVNQIGREVTMASR